MKRSRLQYVIPYIITALLLTMFFGIAKNSGKKDLEYSEFYDFLKTNGKNISEIKMTMNSTVIDVKGVYHDDKADLDREFTVVIPNTEAENLRVLDELEKNAPKCEITYVNPYQSNLMLEVMTQIVPLCLMAGLGIFLISRMNSSSNNKAFEFSKSRARLESNIKVRFDDVAGCEEEKEEMAEIIDYLRAPEKFAKMGARIPKGILMVGNPGTGKTLLAKAVAGEADVPFYSISGADFVEMFVGVGASRVRDMFKKAKSTAPCIIFIDEIDAVGRQRGAGLGGGNDEREQTLNQLLVEMDGIDENKGIVIIAATNRPDILDPALLRPGRFDRQITVSLPDKAGRKAILEVHARNKPLSDEIDLDALAARTPGFSGADLENVLNEAAILAVRNKKDLIGMEELDEAIDRTMGGPAKKSRKYTDNEKNLVATHEAGHAVVGLFLEGANVVQKVTIIPRGQAGGYNLMTPKEDSMFVETKNELLAQITGLLGGRVAEELVLGEISTGASNDLEKVTKLAKAMVISYGMSDKLGPIQYADDSENVFLGRDYTSNKNYSDKIAYEIDEEIRKIVNSCYDKAKEIVSSHRDVLDNIVHELLVYETLTKEDLDNILQYGRKEPVQEETAAE